VCSSDLVLKQGDQRYEIASRGLLADENGWRVLSDRPGQGVRIREVFAGGGEREYTARSALLTLDNDVSRWEGGDWTNTFTLQTQNLTIVSNDGDSDEPNWIGNSRGDREIARLQPIDAPEQRLLAMSSDELLEIAHNGEARDDALVEDVAKAAALLEKRIGKLLREILSKEHERVAYAASSFLMVLVGAIVGFKMRDSLPLPVYLFSFFPAILTFVTITSGKQFVEEAGAAGLPLLWSGVVFFLAYGIFEFSRLRKH